MATKAELQAQILTLQATVDAATSKIQPTQDAFVAAINALIQSIKPVQDSLASLKTAVDSLPDPVTPPLPKDLTQSVVNVPATAKVGDTITATGVWRNETGADMPLVQVVTAVRRPGQAHSGAGVQYDLDDKLTVTSSSKGSITTVNATFKVDQVGTYTVYPTYQTADGVWHDGADYQVVVSAVVVTPPVDPPTPPVGDFLNPLKVLGAQPWQADWGGSNPMQGNTSTVNPQFVADYKAMGFRVFRCMDAIPVNQSQVVTWSQRVQPTGKQSSSGVAIEYLIDIANQTGCDLWLCHPYRADDDYIRQCATLVKSRLRADLRVIPELSNEVWNGAFASFNQAIQAGQAGGLPGSNQWYQGIAHEMYRALQMHAIYEEVFGTAAMGSKVIRVFSHSGNLDLTNNALANVYTSSKWNPKGTKLDMLATAPYVSNGYNGASETLAHFKAEVDNHVNGEPLSITTTMMVKYGIPLLGMYEFSNHHLQGALSFAQNPIAYDCFQYMLDRYMSVVNGPCCLYTSHGSWPAAGATSNGAWGLLPAVGSSIDASHRARSVRDWIAKSK